MQPSSGCFHGVLKVSQDIQPKNLASSTFPKILNFLCIKFLYASSFKSAFCFFRWTQLIHTPRPWPDPASISSLSFRALEQIPRAAQITLLHTNLYFKVSIPRQPSLWDLSKFNWSINGNLGFKRILLNFKVTAILFICLLEVLHDSLALNFFPFFFFPLVFSSIKTDSSSRGNVYFTYLIYLPLLFSLEQIYLEILLHILFRLSFLNWPRFLFVRILPTCSSRRDQCLDMYIYTHIYLNMYFFIIKKYLLKMNVNKRMVISFLSPVYMVRI